MPFRTRRSIKLGKNIRLNLSKKGMSVSTKVGRTTFNSRGRTSTRVAKGVSYTTSKGKPCGFVLLTMIVLFGAAASTALVWLA